jgi:hypothetical protein
VPDGKVITCYWGVSVTNVNGKVWDIWRLATISKENFIEKNQGSAWNYQGLAFLANGIWNIVETQTFLKFCHTSLGLE